MSEAMHAEFDTIADWTASAARSLGSAYYLPAACRGSGSPASLDWLLDHLHAGQGTTVLDCGAGVGGPSAYAAIRRGVRPLLVEPEARACRAAQNLFGLPVVRGEATALPVADNAADAAWSLGVLCTVSNQVGLLTELARVVKPGGRIGLLVFVARHSRLRDVPEGNRFPTTDGLVELLAAAALRVVAWSSSSALAPPSEEWTGRADRVEQLVEERHGGEQAWLVAHSQQRRIAELIADGDIAANLLALSRV